jgi:hypothetical protein
LQIVALLASVRAELRQPGEVLPGALQTAQHHEYFALILQRADVIGIVLLSTLTPFFLDSDPVFFPFFSRFSISTLTPFFYQLDAGIGRRGLAGN